MGKTVKISPIQKTYSPSFKTMESSLAARGFARTPGTVVRLTPQREADGRYRTGLDKDALYIKSMPPEEQEIELQMIDKLLKKLKAYFGDTTNFGPRSDVWQAHSEADVKVSVVPMGNEPLILNPDGSPQNLLDFCWLRVDKRIAKSSESYQRGECPNCQYFIENEEIEAKVIYQKKKLKNDTVLKFSQMSPSKQKQFARLLGLPVTDNSTEETVYNMMDTFLGQSELISGVNKARNPINLFNEIFRLSDDTIAVKDMIEQALRFNVYREGTGGKIVEGGNTIAGSRDELTKFLMDDDNQKDWLALEAKVKNKKILSE